jgi:branched-chain amino acid aminotransferase
MQEHTQEREQPEAQQASSKSDRATSAATGGALRVWMDGAILPLEAARTSPLAHGLHYGTGVFEGVRCYRTPTGRAIFRLDAHLDRMRRGAAHLAMPFDVDAMTRASLEVVAANGLDDAYLRPLSYYESGGLGLDVAPLTPRHMVAAMPWKSHLGDPGARGVRLRTSSIRRIAASAVPALKFCGVYANSILAKLEAVRAGYEEALFVDERGFVCEATGENVFLVKGGRVIAAQHPDALPGITRATILELSGGLERPVTLDELRDADEIFLTGTSAEVAAVGVFDDRDVGIGPVTRELAGLYQALVHGETSERAEWRTTVG